MKAVLFSFLSLAFAQAVWASCGTFEVSKGDVKVQPASGAAVSASVGSKICAGDTVIAADSARAKIKMEDGNELNISPNSKIVIEQYQYDTALNKKKVLLNVLRGKVRATTREENMYNDKAKDGQANTFQVRTKSAVAGVRGTDFLTSFDPKTSQSEVVTFRGKVEVGIPGPSGAIMNSVQVTVGQKTVVNAGQAPQTPRAIPAGDFNKINVESKNSSGAGASNSQPSNSQQASSSSSSGASSSNGRAPASSLGGGMVTSNDLGTAPSGPATLPPTLAAPPSVVPPVIPTLSPTVTNAITTNNSKSNVTVRLHY